MRDSGHHPVHGWARAWFQTYDTEDELGRDWWYESDMWFDEHGNCFHVDEMGSAAGLEEARELIEMLTELTDLDRFSRGTNDRAALNYLAAVARAYATKEVTAA